MTRLAPEPATHPVQLRAGVRSTAGSGAEALARAHHRAAANGTQLRLVVTADPVRRVLSFSGLDLLVSVYPTVEAAVAAGAEHPEVPGERRSPSTGRSPYRRSRGDDG